LSAHTHKNAAIHNHHGIGFAETAAALAFRSRRRRHLFSIIRLRFSFNLDRRSSLQLVFRFAIRAIFFFLFHWFTAHRIVFGITWKPFQIAGQFERPKPFIDWVHNKSRAAAFAPMS